MKKLFTKLVVPITIGAMLLGLFGCNGTDENDVPKINRDVNFGHELSWGGGGNRTEVAGQVVAAHALPSTGYVFLVPTLNFAGSTPGAIERLATNLEYVVAAGPAGRTRVNGEIVIGPLHPATDSLRLVAIGATVVRSQ